MPLRMNRTSLPSMRLPALLVGLACLAMGGAASAQTVSHYMEQGKLMRAPKALGVLGENLFGDKINFYTGSLEFVQEDVSLPGNSALPVAAGRRLKPASTLLPSGHFGNWELEIPHLHGVFATGWNTGIGTDPSKRCSKFGAPQDALSNGTNNQATFLATEFWHGNFVYVPGQGDQEMLRRNAGFSQAPDNLQASYPVVTRNNWQFSCITVGATEYFSARSPDGTTYRFDWEVSRPETTLTKTNPAPAITSLPEDPGLPLPAPTLPTGPVEITDEGYRLYRVEVFVYPTVVTDRFGKTVTYTYDTTNRWQLKTIVGADATGSPRTLTFSYVSPTSSLISSITDGKRTWRYNYSSATGLTILSSVTLPDNSTWQLDGMVPLITQLEYSGDGNCDGPGLVGYNAATGTMTHPSGAQGAFTLTSTRHGRSGVINECYTDVASQAQIPKYPRVFDTLSLTRKVISGPGIATQQWEVAYPVAESSWGPCAGNCDIPKLVDVTQPSGSRTRYTFGTQFRETDGQLQNTEIFDENGALLRSTAVSYAEPIAPRGVSDQGRGDGLTAARMKETSQRTTTQQGVTFTWRTNTFNEYAQPTEVTRFSSLGPTRTETTDYMNSTSKWILGQVQKVAVTGTALVPVLNTYDITTANLLTVTKFGKLEKTLAYNADGTLYTSTDGKSQTTTFSNYKRGIPRTVQYANSTSETAVVNDIGGIDSTTNEAGFTTTYGYDAMGRLASISPPASDTVAWSPTTISYSKSSSAYGDLPGGHWEQRVSTGTGRTSTHLDALWRPVYTEKVDDADAAATIRIVKQEYDHGGRVAFESFAGRSAAALSSGVHRNYDALGRLITTTTDSELGALTVSNDYGNGFTKTTTDARNNATVSGYQVFDEPNESAITSITAPEGVNVVIARDVFGKPSSITRSGLGKSATRSYVYNANQLLCKTIEPETGATVQDYDTANNLTWRATGLALPSTTACDTTNGITAAMKMTFSYDTRNRLLDTTFGDGSPPIKRTYTPDGLLSTISTSTATWTATWTNTYNKRRLLENESLAYGSVTYNIGRKYDTNGSLRQLTYPVTNLAVDYNPNALGEPRQVGTYASAITYYPNGAIAGFTYGNGIKHTLLQNQRGLPQQSTDTGVISDSYAYDANANVASITDLKAGVTTRTMFYDNLDRLKTVSAPGMWGTASYGYDALDNLTSSQIGSGATARNATHVINAATNRIDGISTAPTVSAYDLAYQYDVRGNITKRGTQSYVFDLGNRMTSAVNRASYLYDGLGHRFSVVGSDNVNRVQVYSQAGQLLYVTPTTGTGTHYIYLHNHQIAEVQ